MLEEILDTLDEEWSLTDKPVSGEGAGKKTGVHDAHNAMANKPAKPEKGHYITKHGKPLHKKPFESAAHALAAFKRIPSEKTKGLRIHEFNEAVDTSKLSQKLQKRLADRAEKSGKKVEKAPLSASKVKSVDLKKRMALIAAAASKREMQERGRLRDSELSNRQQFGSPQMGGLNFSNPGRISSSGLGEEVVAEHCIDDVLGHHKYLGHDAPTAKMNTTTKDDGKKIIAPSMKMANDQGEGYHQYAVKYHHEPDHHHIYNVHHTGEVDYLGKHETIKECWSIVTESEDGTNEIVECESKDIAEKFLDRLFKKKPEAKKETYILPPNKMHQVKDAPRAGDYEFDRNGVYVNEHIVKIGNKYRLLSHKGKNLGTFDSHAAAAKHEGEVEWFKQHNEEYERPVPKELHTDNELHDALPKSVFNSLIKHPVFQDNHVRYRFGGNTSKYTYTKHSEGSHQIDVHTHPYLTQFHMWKPKRGPAKVSAYHHMIATKEDPNTFRTLRTHGFENRWGVDGLDEMAGANVKTRELHRHLKKLGWSLTRTSGSHDVFTHPKASHHISVPRHSQLKAPLVKDILKASIVEGFVIELDEAKGSAADAIRNHPAVEYYGGKEDDHFINLKHGYNWDGQHSFGNPSATIARGELKRIKKCDDNCDSCASNAAHFNKEEVSTQLDEMDSKSLNSYIKKAADTAKFMTVYDYQRKKFETPTSGSIQSAHKTLDQVAKAGRKLANNKKDAEEFQKHVDTAKHHASEVFNREDHDHDGKRNAHIQHLEKAVKDIHNHADKMMGESVEPITELSKNLLKKYISRSVWGKTSKDKVEKRVDGVDRATKKLLNKTGDIHDLYASLTKEDRTLANGVVVTKSRGASKNPATRARLNAARKAFWDGKKASTVVNKDHHISRAEWERSQDPKWREGKPVSEGWGVANQNRIHAQEKADWEALHAKHAHDPVMSKHLKDLEWKINPSYAEAEAQKRIAKAAKKPVSEELKVEPEDLKSKTRRKYLGAKRGTTKVGTPAHAIDVSNMKESEQIDELSKGTLASYATKASSSGDERSNSNLASKAAHKMALSTGDKDSKEDDGEKEDKKSFNRSKGIARAIKKLVK